MTTMRQTLDALQLDLKHSWRMLAASRASALLSVLCLSLAIGINTTAFTFVNALLVRPLPLPTPERLVTIGDVRRDDPEQGGPFSHPTFDDVRQTISGGIDMAALRGDDVRVAEDRVPAAYISPNFFSVLGLRPTLGRDFSDDDDRGDGAVVLLSHVFWLERYGGDRAILGQSVLVDGSARLVVGITPKEMSHMAMPGRLRSARVWLPLGPAARGAARDDRRLTVIGRLHDGVTVDAALARLNGVMRELARRYPAENANRQIVLDRLDVEFSATTRAMLLMVTGAVAIVLLIACANVANLTLARTTSRGHEIATRLALGASGPRIVGQLLIESLLIALPSLPVGVALAYAGRNLLLGRDASPELVAGIALDMNVFAFTAGLVLIATLVSGLAPALRAVRVVAQEALRLGGRSTAISIPRHARLNKVLIVAQIALALTLLVGASLFVQSFRNAMVADGSFDTSSILTIRIAAAAPETAAHSAARTSQILTRLSALPGISGTAAANLMPLRDVDERTSIVPDDAAPRTPPTPVLLGRITPRFFEVLDLPLQHGRSFTSLDENASEPVTIVNRTLAQRLAPSAAEAIGRRFRVPAANGDQWFTIVGVSRDLLTWNLSNRPRPTVYLPFNTAVVDEPRIFVRTSGDPALLIPAARAAVQAIDPALTILNVQTMTDVHVMTLSRSRTLASVFVVIGAIALLLGGTGVYGVLSYVVSQRRHEIGVRAALGAHRRALVWLFIRQGMTVTAIGVAIGIGGAAALARLTRSRLHGIDPADPWTFATVTAIISGVALVATYLPARRAAAVDPLTALRE